MEIGLRSWMRAREQKKRSAMIFCGDVVVRSMNEVKEREEESGALGEFEGACWTGLWESEFRRELRKRDEPMRGIETHKN